MGGREDVDGRAVLRTMKTVPRASEEERELCGVCWDKFKPILALAGTRLETI
jgi:hypothetical protein